MPKGAKTKEIKRTLTLPDGRTVRRSFYGRTVEEAEQRWREAQTAPLTSAFPPGSFGWWMVVKWAPLKAHLEEGTLSNYQTAANHLLPELGNEQVKSIDATRLVIALNNIAAKKTLRNKTAKHSEPIYKPLSSSIVNRCRMIALDVCSLAAESGAGNFIRSRRVVRRRPPEKVVEVYSPPEMRLLLEASRGRVGFPLALFCQFLGLTINEARALKASDLSPDGFLRVDYLIKKSGDRSRKMKTEYRHRTFPLPEGILDEVRALAAKGEWLCQNTEGNKISESSARVALELSIKRSGLRRLTHHELRHSFSSWLEENGCPRSIRLALMGQSRQSVADRYNHASEEGMRTWLARLWEASFEQIARPPAPAPKITKVERGGERNSRAKLTSEDIAKILARLEAGEMLKSIAADYKVDRSTIGKIKSGRNWRSDVNQVRHPDQVESPNSAVSAAS